MALVLWTYNNPRVDSRSDQRSFSFCGANIKVLQNFENEISISQNTHFKLWDGAYLLAKFLENQYSRPGFWRGKSVVELGAGCGLVGMVAALLGAATVTLTDGEKGISHTRACLVENLAAHSEKLEKVVCRTLDWCQVDTYEYLKEPCDVILGSDIVYASDQKMLKGLADTLNLISKPETLILISYKNRCLGEDVFFKYLQERKLKWSFVDKCLHPSEFTSSGYDIMLIEKSVI